VPLPPGCCSEGWVEPTAESTPAPAPTPTLVSSTTAPATGLPVVKVTLTEHKAAEKKGLQTISRKHTINTTTPLVQSDTYSDGSVTNTLINSVDTSYKNDKLTGRVDQHEVLDNIGGGLQGLLNHEPTEPTTDMVRVFSKNYYAWSHADYGYYGTSFIYGGGLEIDLKPTWTIGAQYNNFKTNLDGSDSTSKLNKSHVGVFNMFRGNTFSLLTNAGLSQNKYYVKRNVAGIFENDSSTKGQEWWINNRLFWHLGDNVTPFIGHNYGNYQRDSFVEGGSIQSARRISGVNESSHTGEVGLNLSHRFGGKKGDLIGLSVEGSYATDNSVEVSASVDYKEIISIEGIHQISDGVNNTAVSAKVKFRF
jgi:hypothetical protein